MMTLARPPDRWNAETATPPVLETLAAAVDPISGSMVKADVRRLEPWYGFKNGCVVSPRQGVSCASHVRSQLWESEMEDRSFEYFAKQYTDLAAQHARDAYHENLAAFAERCESPIEKIFAAALVYYFQFHLNALTPLDVRFMRHDYRWPNDVPQWNFDADVFFSQANVGPYRVDFLLRSQTERHGVEFLAIECDGHEFHERTKEQAARDRKRDRWMAANGIRVVRFTGSEIWRSPIECVESFIDVFSQIPSAGPKS